jgi:hypothetical protein
MAAAAIADGEGFWAEVKRIANYRMRLLAEL